MSDAKAAAAARRAKILSRDKNRLEIAKGLKDALEDKPEEIAAEIKERPLAYRRRLVKKVKDDDNDEDENANENEKSATTDNKETKNESDNKDETISLLKVDDENNKVSSETIIEPEVKIGKITRRRKPKEEQEIGGMISDVTKRVEREIAEATKNHEIKIQKEDESKSEKSMAIKKRRAEIKANLYQPLKSHQILKMARIVVIILLAFFTGYKFATSGTQSIVAATRKLRDSAGISSTSIFRDLRTATSIKEGYNSMHVFLLPRYHKDSTNQWGGLLKRLNLQLQETGQYENEFDESLIVSVINEENKVADGTWIGWVKNYFYKQIDCTFCALGLVWWLAKVLAYLAEKILGTELALKKAPQEKTNILQTIFKFITEGVDAILEMFYETLGEMALYTAVVFLSSSIIIAIKDIQSSTFDLSGMANEINSIQSNLNSVLDVPSSVEDEL